MAHVATVITPIEAPRLTENDLKEVTAALSNLGVRPLHHSWLSVGEAFDIFFEGGLLKSDALLAAAGLAERPLDCFVQAAEDRSKRLLVADMDSTIIAQECIDEIAAEVDLKDKVAAITEAAMQGKLDFKEALKERVALLKGLDREALNNVLKTRITFNPGAETLVGTLKKSGIKTALVSGGFTFFTQPLGAHLGFDWVLSNELEFEGSLLSGQVKSPIVDSRSKKEFLETKAKELGLSTSNCLALGDGANDIPMFEAAGFSLSYHGKPAAENAAYGQIRHCDLRAVLFALGIPEDNFA